MPYLGFELKTFNMVVPVRPDFRFKWLSNCQNAHEGFDTNLFVFKNTNILMNCLKYLFNLEFESESFRTLPFSF